MATCRHPDKTPYGTKREALDAWRQIREGDRRLGRRGKRRKAKDLTPYRCRAGHWHLGRQRRKMRDL